MGFIGQKLENTLYFKAMKQGNFMLAPLALWSLEFKWYRKSLQAFKPKVASFSKVILTFVSSNQTHL